MVGINAYVGSKTEWITDSSWTFTTHYGTVTEDMYTIVGIKDVNGQGWAISSIIGT